MSIFGLMTKKEFDAALKQALTKLPGWLSATADVEQYRLPDPSIYANQADLYRRLSWVLTAVDLIAHAASLQGFNVMKQAGDDEPEQIPNHPFEVLLQKPNPLDSRMELLYGTIAMWKLTGNAYWWLNRATENVPPDEIWLIPSHMIQPVPDKKMFISGYAYDPGDGSTIPLEPWEVCQFKRFNPFSRFLGLSAIESIAMVASGDLGMQEWNTKLYKESNARLPSILAFEQYPDGDIWENMKKEIRDSAKKRDMMLLRGVGQGGLQWLQNSVSQEDMEFLASRKANRDEIFNVLAPGAASVLDVNATEANAKTGRSTLMEYGVYPMLVTMQEKITSQILPIYGDDLIGEFDDPRVIDRQLELAEVAEYSKTHTVEEVRRKYYQDKPLGDERDKLFPGQVKPEPAPAPANPFQPQAQEQEQPEEEEDESEAPENPAEEPEEPEVEQPSPEQIKALVELDKWEAKCIKAGKRVTWHNVNIPDDIFEAVKAGGDFSIARNIIRTPIPVLSVVDAAPEPIDEAIGQLTETLRQAIKALDAPVPTITPPVYTVNLTANMPQPGEPAVTVNVPQQAAPVVNVAAPVVNNQVSPTPVTVKNDLTIQPAPVSVQKSGSVTVKRGKKGEITGLEAD